MYSADILPVHHMGHSHLLSFWGSASLSRKLRASLGLYWGTWVLSLPRRHRIITLVGNPIRGRSSFCLIGACHHLHHLVSACGICSIAWFSMRYTFARLIATQSILEV